MERMCFCIIFSCFAQYAAVHAVDLAVRLEEGGVIAAGDEGLLFLHAGEQILLAALVQLAEHVVQQHHGVFAHGVLMDLPLRQLQAHLLCLLPLNSLAIDKINVDFDLEITSVGSYDYKSQVNADVQLVEKKAVLNGRIAPAKQEYKKNFREQYDSTLSSRLKVNIHAGRLPLPKGVLTLLDLYTKSIQPIQKIDKQSEKEE